MNFKPSKISLILVIFVVSFFLSCPNFSSVSAGGGLVALIAVVLTGGIVGIIIPVCDVVDNGLNLVDCDGNVTGTSPSAPCSLPWGGTISSGSSVTAYQAASASCGTTCASVSETRTCSGGTLSGSYTSQSCAVASCPPSAVNLSAVQPDYCAAGPGAILSWLFSDPDAGDTQGAYQAQIDNNADFSSPAADSGKVSSASNSYSTTAGALAYDNAYYWRVKVWDNRDFESVWASGSSFSTPKHQYPVINFSWAPASPSTNESVQFADQSVVYGGATKSAWLWAFQDGNPVSSVLQNPTVKFTALGDKTIILRTTDSDGYSCSATNIEIGSGGTSGDGGGGSNPNALKVKLPLPNWKEVAPQ